MDVVFTKGENISAYPELCFDFNNQFLNRQSRLIQYQNSIINNAQNNSQSIIKDIYVEMVDLIKKVDTTLAYNNYTNKDDQSYFNNFKVFYSLLVKLEKLKGWSEVIKHRGDCFWLETDFRTH